ncbi:hypothetical protein N0V84_004700 [Fusarium piperis]|uniref:Uncharacterized protein n=1 Tax=Fusarium piperis TaxID=1435070 RepID=A0A9W9BQY5_9HYPO|nr:hypothetical protein N0V84_004700 [Fusarium piperis]
MEIVGGTMLAGAALVGGTVIVGGTLLGATFVRGITHYRRRRRAREHGEETYTHRSNFNTEASARREDERRKLHLISLSNKRLDQERDTSRGEPVYFSRRIKNGEFNHWVIACYGKKYELRLNTTRRAASGALFSSLLPTKKWKLQKPERWDRLPDLMAHRDEIMRSEGRPYADNYIIALIGWTSLTEAQVDAVAHRMEGKFGTEYGGYYFFGFHDCQSFARGLAEDLISPSNRALDYNWFSDNMEGDYITLLRMEPDSALSEYLHSLVQARIRQQRQWQNQRQIQQQMNEGAERASSWQRQHQQQQQQFAASLSQQQDTIIQYTTQQEAIHNQHANPTMAHHNHSHQTGHDIHSQATMMAPMGTMGQP